MKTRLCFLFCFAFLGIFACVDCNAQFKRSWSDRSGKFSEVATLVDYPSELVVLKKEDGKVIKVKTAVLSDEDRKWLAEVGAKSRVIYVQKNLKEHGITYESPNAPIGTFPPPSPRLVGSDASKYVKTEYLISESNYQRLARGAGLHSLSEGEKLFYSDIEIEFHRGKRVAATHAPIANAMETHHRMKPRYVVDVWTMAGNPGLYVDLHHIYTE